MNLRETFAAIITCTDREALEARLITAPFIEPHLVGAIQRQLQRLTTQEYPNAARLLADHFRPDMRQRPEPLGPAKQLDSRDADRPLDRHATADARWLNAIDLEQ